jgi:Asp-tRNA(Asn)/Glu-tRNA(Gln) amidotransferase A subunit family amidase
MGRANNDAADETDAKIASRNAIGFPFCILISLKDDCDAVGLNTKAGCLNLAGDQLIRNEPAVADLKGAGAIILERLVCTG